MVLLWYYTDENFSTGQPKNSIANTKYFCINTKMSSNQLTSTLES